jgi:uncharacterized membrane protein (DUF4010 family)
LLDNLFSLGLALALGLLVGVERGWQERAAAEGSRIAGIRTFGLIGLLGGLWQLLAREAGEILFAIAFLAFVVLLAISHIAEARVSKDYGVTTLIAAMITFVLGALAVRGHHVIAATGAVLTTILLSLKPLLHRWLQRVEAAELAAALKLLLVSVVILPVLPDQGYGPWQALNPYEIWWLVVLMATISFAAYCAVKVAGAEKGILLTGFLGGLVSSTAATIHLARLARTLEQRRILAAGVLVASATMFIRVLLVATIVNPGLFQPLSLPLVLMTLTIFGFAVLYWVWKRERAVIAPLALHNPVELLRATQFGVLLAFVLLLTKAIQAWLGHTGIYLLAGISGVADVDAITISLARLAGTDLSIQVSSVAVVLATMVNTITKTILAMIIGGRTIGLLVAWPLTIGLAVGAMASWHLLF